MLSKAAEFFKNKDILILGFGREGQATYNYIRKYFPEKNLTIADKNQIMLNDKNIKIICGKNYLEEVNKHEIIMKSPGISFKNIKIKDGITVSDETDIFLMCAPCKTIGITGSKGKTTTSTLTYLMLKEAGFDTKLIGNIGVPVFECMDELTEKSIPVIEMSSHQLEFCTHSPTVAILTNIYEEHLDHYKDGFKGYINAKMNITTHQDACNYFIYNATQGYKGRFNIVATGAISLGIKSNDELPFKINNPHLIGEHLRHDILFAACAARLFGVDNKTIEKSLENFHGIEHRMENIGNFKDIIFYNDVIATIPHAVECAVKALKNVDTLIFGGMDRGLEYCEFESFLENSEISNLIGLKDTGFKILDNLKNYKNKNLIKAENLDQAVKSAFKLTAKGKICLLSPAASSYNEYKNFEEKGKAFKTLVKKYGK